jgi:hypothetical protein
MANSTVQGGPETITEGMAFYYDAANSVSYTGVNTKWQDISRNNKLNTLYNSPTYTSENQGGITFASASDQYFSITAVPLTTEPFAVDIWFKAGEAATGTGYNGILSCVDLYSTVGQGIPTTGWGIGMTATTTNSQYGAVFFVGGTTYIRLLANGPTLTTGQIYHFFMQRNTTTQKLELYVDGVFYNSTATTVSNSYPVNSTANIGTQTWQYGSLYNNNTYYAIKMYTNKVFTSSEVLQNYNTLKRRFGL